MSDGLGLNTEDESNSNNTMPKGRQGRYWILTIPRNKWTVPDHLPSNIKWIRGQEEVGHSDGYHHWQILVGFSKKVRLRAVTDIFGKGIHAELTRSEAAEEYVWKEETRVAGTQFELGSKPFKRNNEKDWEQIWVQAKAGQLEEIPADVRIRCYHTLKRIRKDYETAPFRDGIEVKVFWGKTGSGKSHRMFEEAGKDAYIKSSTTKWWDGYQGQENIIIDEFRGQISVEHLLKWCDKYPCFVEEKGGQVPLKAKKIWIGSNLNPRDWWKEIDEQTYEAFRRRVKVTEFTNAYKAMCQEHMLNVPLPENVDWSWLLHEP